MGMDIAVAEPNRMTPLQGENYDVMHTLPGRNNCCPGCRDDLNSRARVFDRIRLRQCSTPCAERRRSIYSFLFRVLKPNNNT